MNKYLLSAIALCVSSSAFADLAATCKAWDECIKQNCCSGQAALQSPFQKDGPEQCAKETSNADYACNVKLGVEGNALSAKAPLNSPNPATPKNNVSAAKPATPAHPEKSNPKKSFIDWL